jgi:hypothetical protein
MKWPRKRFTVRRMMVLVLVLGVATHLGITAWRVHPRTTQFRHLHVHTGISANNTGNAIVCHLLPRPFWPTYWRALVGLTWKDWPLGRPLCQSHPGWLEERCELANPEIRKDVGPDGISAINTKEQYELYIQLERKRGRDVRIDKDGNLVPPFPEAVMRP